LGVIYDQGGLYASLIAKHVGSTVQAGVDSNITIAGYTTSDLAMVYTVRDPGFGARAVRVKFGVTNLSDKRSQYFIYGSTIPTAASPGPNGNGYDDYMTLPGRAYSLGLSADF
jgi:outer membrane receptor protein involved in Fe transport